MLEGAGRSVKEELMRLKIGLLLRILVIDVG